MVVLILGVNKNCTVMTHALSQLYSLAEDLQLAGVEGQMDGKLCSSGEGRICLYVYVCLALPMIVGAWSMAVMLW